MGKLKQGWPVAGWPEARWPEIENGQGWMARVLLDQRPAFQGLPLWQERVGELVLCSEDLCSWWDGCEKYIYWLTGKGGDSFPPGKT